MGLDTLAAKGDPAVRTILQYAWEGTDLNPQPVPLDGGDAAARREFSQLVKLLQPSGGTHGPNGGGIRGRHYAGSVMLATGVSLFSEWIPADVVASMAGALSASYDSSLDCSCEGCGGDESGYRYLTEDGRIPGGHMLSGEYGELVRFFGICAEHGYSLVGKW